MPDTGDDGQRRVVAERAGTLKPAPHGRERVSFAAMPMTGTETVVMKFGGTSVADAERIKRAAGRIVRREGGGQGRGRRALRAREDDGRAGVAMAQEVSERPHPREMDMLLSTGERMTRARSRRW